MSDYQLEKEIAEIKKRLDKIEKQLEAVTYNGEDDKGPKEPKLPGGNGGATGRPNK